LVFLNSKYEKIKPSVTRDNNAMKFYIHKNVTFHG